MKIRYLKPHLKKDVGDTDNILDERANYLVNVGVAEAVTENKSSQNKTEEKQPAKHQKQKAKKEIKPAKEKKKVTVKGKREMDISTKGLKLPVRKK